MAEGVQAEERHRRAPALKVGTPGRLHKTPPHHHVTHLPLVVKWPSPQPLPPT